MFSKYRLSKYGPVLTKYRSMFSNYRLDGQDLWTIDINLLNIALFAKLGFSKRASGS